jgi:predicted nucleic acid-binding protein
VKLLVDTSVWTLALRRKNTASLSPEEQKLKAELVQAIQDGRVAMIGLLRQEILSGIKENAQFDKVKAALDPYLDEPIHTADHEYAARVYNECRNQGVEAGTVDILICAIAVRRGWRVLSGDGGLNRCLAITKKFHEKQKMTPATEGVKTRRSSRK